MYRRQKNEIKKWTILNVFLCVISLLCSLSLLYSTSLMRKTMSNIDRISMASEESMTEETVESTEFFTLGESCEGPIILMTEEETTVAEEETETEEETTDVACELPIEDREILAALVQAEAGNQDLIGMRYVVDVVLNRVDDPRFPDTIEEVIYEPKQFTVTRNGMLESAKQCISENAYLAVDLEWENRLDNGVLYFNSGTSPANGCNTFKHQDHWFGY